MTPSGSEQGLSLLYVDDEPALLDIAKIYMESRGYHVTVCESAVQALPYLESGGFDAVISDYQMPDVDGVAFLKALRERGDNIPFIIFTGKDREDVVIDALNMGADFYVKKGGDPRAQFTELLNKVEYSVLYRANKDDLEKINSRFNRVLSLIPDMVSIHDRDMNILYSNWKGFAAVPDEKRALNTKCHRTYRGFDDICPDCQAVEVLETRRPFQTEVMLDEGHWIDLRVIPVLDEDGEVEMFVEWVRDISDIKMTEVGLRKGNERLHNLVDGIYGGLWEFDPSTGRGNTDERFASMLGYRPEEITHLTVAEWARFVHPDDSPRFLSAFQAAICGESPRYELDHRLRHKDGHYIWMRATGMMELLTDGVTPPKVRGVNIDITDIKESEEELKRQKTLVESIIDGVGDILAIQHPDHTVERYNRAGYEALGISPEEAEGRKCYQLLGREKECDNCVTKAAMLAEEPVEVEKYAPEMGRHLLCRNTPVINEDGEIIRVVQHLRDVSESDTAVDANRAGEDRYRMLVESSIDVIWSLDTDSIIRYISPAIGRIGGHQQDGLTGKSFLEFIHPNDLKAVENVIAQVIDERVSSEEIEFRVMDSEGEWIWTSNSITLLTSDEGEPIGPIGVSRDINEKKRSEEVLEKARNQLSLLGSITRHDINNKAFAARGYLDLMKETQKEDASMEMLENVDHCIKNIISNIEFSQGFQELGAKAPRWINLCEMLESLSARVDLSIEVGCGEVEIFADPMFYKVFENLLENTISHSGTSSVSVGAHNDGGDLVISLEDDGVGVPYEAKERIFERSYGDNTGMGLFLAKEILAITDISIREKGVPGEGAVFEIVIPRGTHRGFVGSAP